MATNSTSSSLNSRISILMAAVLLGSLSLMLLPDGEEDAKQAGANEQVLHEAVWRDYFSNLDELSAGADVVIRAQIEQIGEGRTVGDESDSIQFTESEVRVLEALRGDVRQEESLLLETDFTSEIGSDWLTVGNNVVLFLVQKSDDISPPRYRPINGVQAIYVTNGSGELASIVDDPLGARISALNMTELRQRIRGPE